MNINERIKIARNKLGLSQKDFGAGINISNNSIYRIENGTRNPSERTLEDICEVYNINKEWLLTGDESNGIFNKSDDGIITTLKSKYNLDDLDTKIIKAYLSLSPIERQVLKDFISKVKGSAD